MNEHEIRVSIPKFEQKQNISLCTQIPKPQMKKPVALFSSNMLTQAVFTELKKESGITEEELDKLDDTLWKTFREADKEDLYGRLFNENACNDYILNENEQKNFLALLKEKSSKLYELAKKYVEEQKAQTDAKKIAENLVLKSKDWYMLRFNEQIAGYGLSNLNNDNMFEVTKEYDDTCILYQLYADIKERVDEEIPEEKELSEEEINEIKSNIADYFPDGEEITEEKINKKIEEIQIKNKEFREECIQAKQRAEKDMEALKEKALDYANYVIQLAKKNKVYSEDYEKELLRAMDNNDMKNIAIYTQRLSDRIFMLNDKEEKTVRASKRAIELKEANGQIDTTYVQGFTGDCWFLSALKSLCSNKEVLNRINNMITLNKEYDVIKSITVKIQDKEYTIDYENIKGANEYSTGDLDVRALEMAVNQYMHEKNLLFGDITLGGWEEEAYKILLGEDNVDIAEYDVDGNKWKFDSEKYLKTLNENYGKIISNLSIYPYDSFLMDEKKEEKVFAEDKDGNQVELFRRHAYNYTRIDDKYLYFTDPHAPEKELKVLQTNVGKVFDAATTVKIKDNDNDLAKTNI